MTSRGSRRQFVSSLAALAGSGALSPAAHAQIGAQGYPSRPIRFIVAYGPGTSPDLQGRFMATRLAELAKQSVVVENRPGANGILGTQYVLTQPADGYVLTIGGNTTHAANPSLYRNLPYDPVKDFVAVSGVSIGGGALVTRPDFPARNVVELVELARRSPGKYTFGSASAFARVALENLVQLAGVNIVHVPYKGSSSLSSEVLAGTVDLAFEPLVTMVSLIKSGKIRALGVSMPQRSPELPDVPTIAEQGLSGYKLLGWLCAFARTGTPPEIVNQLNAWFVQILKTPEARDFFRQNAVWDPMIMTPQQAGAFVASEVEAWRETVQRAKIEPQ